MIEQISDYLSAGKDAVTILKGLRDLIPNGKQKDDIDAKIKDAEKALRTAEAAAAKDLGYHLCRCTFPPQIMLYQAARKAHACPACPNEILTQPSVNRRGGSWMAV